MTRRQKHWTDDWMRALKQLAFLAIVGAVAMFLGVCWIFVELVQVANR